MIDGKNMILSEEEIVTRAYTAMEECVKSIRIGSLKWAARSRGEAAMWDFILFFNFGLDDTWKNDHWYEMLSIADAANV